ncbi:MAG: CHASE3 domain-containing protein, partial [Thermoleophilaceae bacterium]
MARVLAITALVGAAVALAVVAWQTDRHANALDGRARAITSSAHRTLVDLLNAETGQRGFLLSGDPVHLRPYRSGSGAANSDLAMLTRVSGTVPILAAAWRHCTCSRRASSQSSRGRSRSP